jgi:hypothetical protein
VIIAPTVLITSCALLINGLLQRFENMSTRLRGMNLERLRHLREVGDRLTDARLRQIDVQEPRMLRRLKLLRNALVIAYLSIFISVISMLVLATAVLAEVPIAAALALVLLLIGTVALLISVAITTMEVWRAHLDVLYEMADSASIAREPPPPSS